MELKKLVTETERRAFAQSLVEIRKARGGGFAETARSHIGQVHLTFGRLYGLFDDQSTNPDEMIAGFVLHDLASFSQSYPKPDLSAFAPEFTFECGELWAKAAGAARPIRQAAWILVGELQAQAVLVYPIFKPWNLTTAYNGGFARVGEPIEWPYARTLEDGKIWVQAMVSQGDALADSIKEARAHGCSANDDASCIRFNSPFQISTRSFEERLERRLARRATAEGRAAAA